MPVDVVGHSYGGRIGLGAALRTASIGRLVVYEGAPAPAGAEGYADADAEQRIGAFIEAGQRDEALQEFFRAIVGMSTEELARYRADPIWPRRVAAVHTSLREIRADSGEPAASLEGLAGVTVPVLQVVGGDSRPVFHDSVAALAERLPNSRVVVIPGARHAAHHTHVAEFVAAIRAFLTAGDAAD
jgi:pimeloyl-ACP methyl ester carboxylesterase